MGAVADEVRHVAGIDVRMRSAGGLLAGSSAIAAVAQLEGAKRGVRGDNSFGGGEDGGEGAVVPSGVVGGVDGDVAEAHGVGDGKAGGGASVEGGGQAGEVEAEAALAHDDEGAGVDDGVA